jgi:Mlc titration factor MtfA (ptsG expression regulator)
LSDQWRSYLQKNLGWYPLLNETERRKLEGDLKIFIAEKNWEGCAGLVMTDEIKVTIAGQASLLSLAWKDYHFDQVRSILVYPAAYRAKGRQVFGQSLPAERIGEAFGGDSVVLSWRDSLVAARSARDGQNVVLHEFAHIIDMENGDSDGIPAISNDNLRRRWRIAFEREFRQMTEQLALGRPTLLEPYAGESEAEFFAIATEAFFESALAFRQLMPEFYGVMTEFFGQDPAQRFSSFD